MVSGFRRVLRANRLASEGVCSACERPLHDATDDDIRAWVDRHDLGGVLGYGTDARAAFEDARTATNDQAAGVSDE